MNRKVLGVLAAASALGVGFPMGLPRVKREQYPDREKTPEDIARLEAAAAKRKRKALKRQGRK